MNALRVAAGVALVLGLTSCGSSDENAAASPVMPDVVGQQLDVALGDIEEAGFEADVDIEGGGTFGVVDESNWTVCAQSPEAGEDVTDPPKLTVDRSCDDGGDAADESTTTPSETEPGSTEPSTTSAPPPTEPQPEEVPTAASSPELAEILTDPDNCSSAIEAFASANGAKTIEFDGNISAVAPAGDDTTRFDILVVPGDYSETAQVGPTFQFRDVGTFDLNLSGPNVPDQVLPGDNIHVIAKVEDYDSSSCLFVLDPVSTTYR